MHICNNDCCLSPLPYIKGHCSLIMEYIGEHWTSWGCGTVSLRPCLRLHAAPEGQHPSPYPSSSDDCCMIQDHTTRYNFCQTPPDFTREVSERQHIILQLSIYMVAPSVENYLQLENNWSQRAYLLLTVRCVSPLSHLHWPKPVCHCAKKTMHCLWGQLACIQSTFGSG